MKKIVILISGRGSNMQAILEARLPLTVAAVISNDPEAGGLATAQKHDIATRVVDHRPHRDRAAFDAALGTEIDSFKPDLVVLAGFMRILTDAFVNRYRGRLINIHPSLLPAFTGLHTHRRALEAGVKVHGCTVHFVTPELDHGPIRPPCPCATTTTNACSPRACSPRNTASIRRRCAGSATTGSPSRRKAS